MSWLSWRQLRSHQLPRSRGRRRPIFPHWILSGGHQPFSEPPKTRVRQLACRLSAQGTWQPWFFSRCQSYWISRTNINSSGLSGVDLRIHLQVWPEIVSNNSNNLEPTWTVYSTTYCKCNGNINILACGVDRRSDDSGQEEECKSKSRNTHDRSYEERSTRCRGPAWSSSTDTWYGFILEEKRLLDLLKVKSDAMRFSEQCLSVFVRLDELIHMPC